MGKEILSFGDIEIEKDEFCCHKSPTFSEDIDTEKVSNKISFDEKNYMYYKPLHIMLPKTTHM